MTSGRQWARLCKVPVRAVSALAVTLAAFAGEGAQAEGFAAGEWRHQTRMVSADVPGIPQFIVRMVAGNSDRKSCFTAEQAAGRQEMLLTEDGKAQCRTDKLVMAGDGRLEYRATCMNKRFPDPMNVVSIGTWSPTSYQFRATTTGMRHDKPVKIVTEGNGSRVAAACR